MQSEWISVEYRHPDSVTNVLVFSNDIITSWVDVAWNGGGDWYEADKEDRYVPIVTHWMPFPPPPE